MERITEKIQICIIGIGSLCIILLPVIFAILNHNPAHLWWLFLTLGLPLLGLFVAEMIARHLDRLEERYEDSNYSEYNEDHGCTSEGELLDFIDEEEYNRSIKEIDDLF